MKFALMPGTEKTDWRAHRRFGLLPHALMLCAVLLLAVGGCQQTAPSAAAGDDVAAQREEEEEAPLTAADVPLPADYADAVKRLFEYRDAVRQAVSSGHLHDAHRPLDETTIALERLPAIAKASGVPRRHWESLVVAGDNLAEALAVIHEAIDAGDSPDYEKHAPAIDDALQRLQAVATHALAEPDLSEGKKP